MGPRKQRTRQNHPSPLPSPPENSRENWLYH